MPTLQNDVTVRTIRVHVVRNAATGLLVALSPEMRGLMLAARSEEQIESELSDAIREILEAEGHRVLSVTTEPEPAGLPQGFLPSALVASARLAG